MEKQLPKGWVLSNVGEVFDLRQGNQVSKPDQFNEQLKNMIRFLRIVDFTRTDELPRYIKDPGEDYHMSEDDIALVRYGTVGFVCTGKKGVIANNLFRVIPKINLNKRYVYHFLKSGDFQNNLVSKGATMQALSFKTVKPISFPLPPRAEQDRIVVKVDALMAQHAAIQQAMERIPQLLKDFRQQVLTQAVTGRLTEEWRVGKELEEWENRILNEISERITVGFVGKMADKYVETGVPFLRSQNVREFKYSEKGLLYISEEFHKNISKSKLNPGDVVIVRSGFPGTACVIPEKLKDSNCSDILILTPNKFKLNAHYLTCFMNSNAGKQIVFSGRVGNAQQHFNTKTLKTTEIPLPPLQEQQEIVRRVESLFEKATAIEQRYEQLKSQIDSLPQAILHKAFKGELVDQLDSDGSASELLKEIEGVRGLSKSKKR